MKNNFRKAAKASLILIYIVIIAGAVVRMTGSGMGCPDWPKCFGYLIPPTERAELEWKPNTFYKEGRIIIVDEALRITSNDFTSSLTYNDSNWDAYTEHDYAIFNPLHTWIEYINRLFGALSGIPVLLMTVLSFFLFKDDKWLAYLSVLTLIALGFTAWLGKTVVDSNLAPVKITIHMVVALLIVALILSLIYRSKERVSNFSYNTPFNRLLIVSVLLTLIQIILGTQVRQFVDMSIKQVGYESPELWLNNPTITFYIHRSLSILVVVLNGFLWYLNKQHDLRFSKINWVMIFIGIEALTGVLMYYVDFPFGSQPIHLVIATLLFGIQFYLFLESRKASVSVQSS